MWKQLRLTDEVTSQTKERNIYPNHLVSRSEGKTDDQQQWKTPSEKIQAQFPKGETVEQIFGAQGKSSIREVRIQGDPNEVKSPF